ncbi:MAG: phosphatase PAP2 family protein [Dehalococcoidia bacterium]|nr:phosphatase PAP2 family protein [Dehalococcoidia bacterium]
MEALLQWGLDLILAIQQIHGPVLDGIFRAITFMGEEEFYLILLPLLLWCVDFGLGARLGVLFLLSSYLNFGLKDLFRQPRPFDLDPSVKLSSAEGYGLPSGHSQSAVVVWGSIAAWARQRWFWAVAIALMVLIGFSRVYLGVHFPTDVLAGWAIGAVLLVVCLAVQSRVEKWLAKVGLATQIILALMIPLILLLVHPTKDSVTTLAPLCGLGLGLALTHRYISFSARGPWWQRVLRFLVGGIVMAALYLGLKAVFPGEESALYLVFRFLRYWLIGVWITLGAPWLFRLLRLTTEAERLA